RTHGAISAPRNRAVRPPSPASRQPEQPGLILYEWGEAATATGWDRKNAGGGRVPPPAQMGLNENYQFLVMRMPNRRGSVTKMLVARPVSSEFRKAPVMWVTSRMFFT